MAVQRYSVATASHAESRDIRARPETSTESTSSMICENCRYHLSPYSWSIRCRSCSGLMHKDCAAASIPLREARCDACLDVNDGNPHRSTLEDPHVLYKDTTRGSVMTFFGKQRQPSMELQAFDASRSQALPAQPSSLSSQDTKKSPILAESYETSAKTSPRSEVSASRSGPQERLYHSERARAFEQKGDGTIKSPSQLPRSKSSQTSSDAVDLSSKSEKKVRLKGAARKTSSYTQTVPPGPIEKDAGKMLSTLKYLGIPTRQGISKSLIPVFKRPADDSAKEAPAVSKKPRLEEVDRDHHRSRAPATELLRSQTTFAPSPEGRKSHHSQEPVTQAKSVSSRPDDTRTVRELYSDKTGSLQIERIATSATAKQTTGRSLQAQLTKERAGQPACSIRDCDDLASAVHSLDVNIRTSSSPRLRVDNGTTGQIAENLRTHIKTEEETPHDMRIQNQDLESNLSSKVHIPAIIRANSSPERVIKDIAVQRTPDPAQHQAQTRQEGLSSSTPTATDDPEVLLRNPWQRTTHTDELEAFLAKEAENDKRAQLQINYQIKDFFAAWPQHAPCHHLPIDIDQRKRDIEQRPNRRQIIGMPYVSTKPLINYEWGSRIPTPSTELSITPAPGPEIASKTSSSNIELPLPTSKSNPTQVLRRKKRRKARATPDEDIIYADDIDVDIDMPAFTQARPQVPDPNQVRVASCWQDAIELPRRLVLGFAPGRKLIWEPPLLGRGRSGNWWKATVPED